MGWGHSKQQAQPKPAAAAVGKLEKRKSVWQSMFSSSGTSSNLKKTSGSSSSSSSTSNAKTFIDKTDFEYVCMLGIGAYGKVAAVRLKESAIATFGIEIPPEENLMALKIVDKSKLLQDHKEQATTELDILVYLNQIPTASPSSSSSSSSSSVRHPLVVCLYFAFQTKTKLFLAMDFVGGCPLEKYVSMRSLKASEKVEDVLARIRPRVNEMELTHIAAELIVILQYLHRNGVVYRDLRPDNIIITTEGHLKLLDFGAASFLIQPRKKRNNGSNIAKEASTETVDSDQPTISYALRPLFSLEGAFGWKAPEMIMAYEKLKNGSIENEEGYGMSVDWWNLGVLLLSLCNRMPPFRSDRDVLRYSKLTIEDPFETINKPGSKIRKSQRLSSTSGSKLSLDRSKRLSVISGQANEPILLAKLDDYSKDICDLIFALLEPDLSLRFGCDPSTLDIQSVHLSSRNHILFKSINWDGIERGDVDAGLPQLCFGRENEYPSLLQKFQEIQKPKYANVEAFIEACEKEDGHLIIDATALGGLESKSVLRKDQALFKSYKYSRFPYKAPATTTTTTSTSFKEETLDKVEEGGEGDLPIQMKKEEAEGE